MAKSSARAKSSACHCEHRCRTPHNFPRATRLLTLHTFTLATWRALGSADGCFAVHAVKREPVASPLKQLCARPTHTV
jgi:hypothetical protein